MLTITVTISDLDELALRNDLLDPAQWLQDAMKGKINNCRSRMCNPDISPHVKQLFADPTVETIPANQDALIALIVARPDYKDRAAREAESKALLIAGTQNDLVSKK